ncbi:hypothetical protein ACEWY4_024262 [Coilia grayii]|uniref:G-protein coupled receptors family 1 profile domain-containing protein n=1 Tax=Coilia grayii TaxID=363190 RepID=A0ABD1J0T9_9TELE
MENPYKSKLPNDVNYFIAGYLLIIAIASVLGNAILIITSLRRFSKLKAPEFLLVNLALSDLLGAIFMYPLSIVSAFSHEWLGGELTCAYYGLMGFLHGGASITTFMLLAIVRCIISFSAHYPRKWLTRKKLLIIIALVWIHSLWWALMPLWGCGKYGPEPHGLSCTLAWGELREAGGLSFIFSSFAFMLVFPAIVIVTCYTCIACRLSSQHRRTEGCRRMSHQIRVVQRVVLMAVLMSAGFLVAWIPYAAVSFWLIFNPTSPLPPVVSLLPTLFAKSATTFNPIILYIMSSHFRCNARKLVADVCLGVKASVATAETSLQHECEIMSNDNALS